MSSMDGWEHCGGKRRRLRDEGSSEPILQLQWKLAFLSLMSRTRLIRVLQRGPGQQLRIHQKQRFSHWS
ncbi:hypothetical protein PVAP13_5KG306507 [Panicum virgatum]|uniref:Uncharacterized protein n=1 Tax=Panicum virgatum TaxID=38727 RepID=A0A8T0SH63_PANVG|nr:hypothetical protein PVAP13_5KG306507 [Panicum virgatum]